MLSACAAGAFFPGEFFAAFSAPFRASRSSRFIWTPSAMTNWSSLSAYSPQKQSLAGAPVLHVQRAQNEWGTDKIQAFDEREGLERLQVVHR